MVVRVCTRMLICPEMSINQISIKYQLTPKKEAIYLWEQIFHGLMHMYYSCFASVLDVRMLINKLDFWC